jgi:hypothetical protein
VRSPRRLARASSQRRSKARPCRTHTSAPYRLAASSRRAVLARPHAMLSQDLGQLLQRAVKAALVFENRAVMFMLLF